MIREEIQYSLDRRNFVDITEDSTCDGPLQVGHLTGKVVFRMNGAATLTNAGNAGRHLVEFNYLDSYTHDPCEIYFEGVDHVNSAGQSGFFKVIRPNTSPSRAVFQDCRLRADSNYAIDCPDGGDMECLVIEKTQFSGGGAVRWNCNSSASQDFAHLITNRYIGRAHVGPCFNFKNMQNLTMRTNILDGTAELIDNLKNEYAGPIAFRVINPKGRCIIDDFWFEPWSDWSTDAPGCWGFSSRTDDTSGNYGQHLIIIRNASMNATGLSAGVKLQQFIGGGDSANAASMLQILEDQFKQSDASHLFGGKIRVINIRSADNSDMDDAIEATIDGYVADSWRDPLRYQAYNKVPFNEFSDNEAGGASYGSSQLQTDWAASVTEYDEGLI